MKFCKPVPAVKVEDGNDSFTLFAFNRHRGNEIFNDRPYEATRGPCAADEPRVQIYRFSQTLLFACRT